MLRDQLNANPNKKDLTEFFKVKKQLQTKLIRKSKEKLLKSKAEKLDNRLQTKTVYEQVLNKRKDSTILKLKNDSTSVVASSLPSRRCSIIIES